MLIKIIMNPLFIYPNIIFGIGVRNPVLSLKSMFCPNNKNKTSARFQFCRNYNLNCDSVLQFRSADQTDS